MARPSRVLVIGSGPGGLALAHRLLRAGVEVALHEKDPALDTRSQGYRISLQESGWASLRACLPADVYALAEATAGVPLEMPSVYDEQLGLIGPVDGMGFTGSRPIDRAVLRHVLARGLEGRIRFGSRFSRFEQDGDRVRVVFADGGEDTGDVVVGADGAFSGVRRQLHPEVGFVASELVAAMGRTPLSERFAPLHPESGAMVRGPGLNLNVGPLVFATPPTQAAPGLPATESYLRWLLLLPPDHPVARSARRGAAETVTGVGHDARETVLDLIEGWHPLLRELVDHTSEHNNWLVTPKLLDRPLPPWDTERVTLLGDAAHLTIPSGGNGLATALRDAALLGERLAGTDDAVAALRDYQAEMLVYGQAAVDAGVDRQRLVVPAAPVHSPSS